MKLKYILPVLLLLCSVTTATISAQTYPIPSRELVQNLLEELDECKKNLERSENEIGIMENNPGQYSLELYLSTKAFIKELKACVKSNRAQLDLLRKDYPGWFNSPSAFADIRMSWPKIHSPQEIADALARVEARMERVFARFEILQVPED